MRRGGLKRKAPMKQRQPRRPSDKLYEAMEAFARAVAYRRCAGCGINERTLYNRAHHVVYKQHLSVEHQWDGRNALSLCDDCHERHHNASRRIPIAALTEQNWEFAREVLGQAADDYLARYYAPSVPEGEERNG